MTTDRSFPVSRRQYLTAVAATPIMAAETGADTAATGGDELWSFTPDGRAITSLTVMDGMAYFGFEGREVGQLSGEVKTGVLSALDVGTGERQWLFAPPTGQRTYRLSSLYSVSSSPTVVDGTAFVAAELLEGDTDAPGGKLYAVERTTGDVQWEFSTPGSPAGSPIVADGTLYILIRSTPINSGGIEGRLYAVDAEGGRQEWAVNIAGWIRGGSPAVVDDAVYVYSRDGIKALEKDTGVQKWIHELDSLVEPGSALTVADGKVYASTDSSLVAVNAETGGQKWKIETGESATGLSATARDGTVYAIDNDEGDLLAVDAESGTRQWGYSAVGETVYPPTVAEGSVFIGCSDGYLYAIDGATGNEQWRSAVTGSVTTALTMADGVVYAGTDNGAVAVDAGVDGSSDGSRVMQGTMGHHDDWLHADQRISVKQDADLISLEEVPERAIRTGAGALAGSVVGAGYLLKQRADKSGCGSSGDNGFFDYLHFALNPRAYHERVGSIQSELLSSNGLRFLGALLMIYIVLLFGIGGPGSELSFLTVWRMPTVELVEFLLTAVMLVGGFFLIVVCLLAGYLAVVSRQSALRAAPHHLFGLVLYTLPVMIAYLQIRRGAFDALGSGAFTSTLFGPLATDPDLVPFDLFQRVQILAFGSLFVLSLLGCVYFFYYDGRYRHDLNRIEAIIAAALVQAILWGALLMF